MWHLRCYYVPHPINSITRLRTGGIPGAGINRPATIRPLVRVAARDRAPFADHGRRARGSQQRRPALAALINTVGFAVRVDVISVESETVLTTQEIAAALLEQTHINRCSWQHLDAEPGLMFKCPTTKTTRGLEHTAGNSLACCLPKMLQRSDSKCAPPVSPLPRPNMTHQKATRNHFCVISYCPEPT